MNAPNPLYPEDDPVERAKAFLRKRHVVDDINESVPDYVGELQREREARRNRPMSEKLGTLGKEAWQFATGRHEAQAKAGEQLGSNAAALARMRGNQGDVGGAQMFGFMQGVAEATPRALNPTTVTGLALGGTPGLAAATPRAILAANEALQLSDAIASAKESADAFGEGNTGMGLTGLATSTVGAVLSALGLKGLVTPRMPRPAAGAPNAGPRPAPQRPPSVSVDGSPYTQARPAGAPPRPSERLRGLPESILEGELIHEAGPSTLPGPAGLLAAPGARPGDGGAIITPPPPAGPQPPPRIVDALDRTRPQMPPARPDPFSTLPAPDPTALAAAEGLGGPLAPGLMDAMAPPAAAQQRVRLSQPVDLMGERVRDLTIAGDQVTVHRQDGTTMTVPRAALEQLGVPLPPPGGRLRSSLEALQAQRTVPAPEPAVPQVENGFPRPSTPDGPVGAVEPPPLSLDQDAQLSEILAMLRGTPDDLADFDVLPPAFGGRGENVPSSLADFEHLPPPPPEMGELAEAFRVPRADAPPFELQPQAAPRANGAQQNLPDPLDELERMFAGEPELPPAQEWTPGAARTEPELELVDDGPLGNNASGESGASMEAMSRLRDMKARGEQFVVLDRGGRERPLIGADAVDYQPAKGETFAIRQADGSYRVLQENGGRVPQQPVAPAQKEIAPPPIDEAPPAAAAAAGDDDPIAHVMRELGIAGAEMPPEQLVRQAFTDDLTGLPNRPGLQQLEQRGGGNNLFAALDVRNLKAVNDLLGMQRGDELIKTIGEELGRSLRKGDVPARFGGDEFMLMLQGVGEEGRPVVQQKIMQAVDRALERFGTRQAGDFPLGARMAFGADRDSALAEMTRQKGMEKGPKFRPMGGAEAGALPRPPANPVPGVRYELPSSAIDVDPSRFQYRRTVNKRGVDPNRKIEGKYDPARGGIIGVWRDPADGKTYVVNGHHRLELAQEQGADVGVVYLDAPDAAAARAEGALINLSEGNSSMADAVTFLRDTGYGVEALREYGITARSTIGKDAPAIASLSDPVRAKWEAGDLDDGLAATIGHAKLAPEQQAAVAQLVERQKANGRGVTPAVLKNVIEQVRRADTVNMAGQGAQSNIFDVLGEDQFASAALTRAELTDHIRQQLAKDKRLFGFVAKGDRAGKLEAGGVGSIDAGKAGDIAAQAAKVGSVFDSLEQAKGPINDALNDAARRIMQGENANVVRQEALAAIRLGVESELRAPRVPDAGAAGEPPPIQGRGREAAEIPEVGARTGTDAGRAVVEPQPRLPGDVGAVRDIEQPPALFDAPFALQRQPAGDLVPRQPDALAELERALDPELVDTPAPANLDAGGLPAGDRAMMERALGGAKGPNTIDVGANGNAPAKRDRPWADNGNAVFQAKKVEGAPPRDALDELNDIALPPAPKREGAIFDQPDEIPGTYGQLRPNERDFLTKRLKYTKADIDGMTVDEARRIGKEQVFNPKLTERKADAAARYDRALDEVSADFEAGFPERVRSAAENRRQARGPAAPDTAARLERQAGMRAEAEAEVAAARATPVDEKRAATPREMKAKQDAMAHRARAIGKAMDTGDYDEAARLIGEQAEDWNTQRLKAGTKEENKVPGKHRNGEYLASDFAAVHQVLFTPEGRAKLQRFAVEAAKNPAIRGLVGGVIGASTGDTLEDQIRNGLIGMVAAAGTPKGLRALGDAFDHYRRTGNIMRKSPGVSNQDIGYWRAFVAPNTIERTLPDVYARAREVLKDLQEYRHDNPKLKPEQHQAAEKIARGEMVAMMRHEAAQAMKRGQPKLAKRLEMTANQMAHTHTVKIRGKDGAAKQIYASGGTAGQRLLKDTLELTGIKKGATGREFEHVAQKAIYRVTLGYALDSAAKNLFQPTLALLHVSPRNMIRALRAARTTEGDELFNSLELKLQRPVETEDEMGELLGVTSGGRASDSGRFMRATDNWNRKWVFFGSLAEQGELDAALAGKASPKAIEEAERVMRMTQGETGPMSSAPMFRGPVGGTMKPFMKYPNLAIENIIDAFDGSAKYPKTAVMTMLGLGLTGAAFGLDLTDILIGGARPLGLDPFHPRRAQLPPALAAARRVGDYVSGEARFFGDFIPDSLDPVDVANSDLAYLVGGRYPTKVAKTIGGLSSSDDPVSDLASLLGLTTSEKATRRDERQEAYEWMIDARQQQSSQSRRDRARLERALKGGDTDAVAELEAELTPRQVKEVQRKIERGDLESIRRRVPLDRRDEFDRRFGEAMARERAERAR